MFVYFVATDVLDRAHPEDCNMCAYANYTLPTRFLYDSDEFFAVRSKYPDCNVHYLVLPKQHIKNIHSAEVTCEMLAEMRGICSELLEEIELQTKILFHNPPFYSMKHLHLHCMACAEDELSLLTTTGLLLAFNDWFSPSVATDC